MNNGIVYINNNIIFNPKTGCFLKVGKYIIEALKEYQYLPSNLENKDLDINKLNKAKKIVKDKIDDGFWGMTESSSFLTPSLDDIKEHKAMQFSFNVTESCNLKCSYCPYTLSENNYRSHTKKTMSIEIADKAIELLKKRIKKNSFISFYGGEPLLNFKLIKHIVTRIKKELPNYNTSFAMTTNLTVLSKESAEFLSENNFILTISLDGTKELHDKNRKNLDGKGTYETVIKNLLYLKINYPIYYSNNVTSNTVITSVSDFDIIDSFFSNNIDFTFSKFTIGNDYNSPIYKCLGVSPEIIKNELGKWGIEKLKTLKDKNEMKSSRLLLDLLSNNIKPIEEARGISSDKLPFKSCIPGHKIFVNTDGTLSVCEKAESLIIGDVKNGMDYKYIMEIIDSWIKLTKGKCLKCWMSGVCNVCFLSAWDGYCFDEDKLKKHCTSLENSIIEWSNAYLPLKMKDNSFFDILNEIDDFYA